MKKRADRYTTYGVAYLSARMCILSNTRNEFRAYYSKVPSGQQTDKTFEFNMKSP